MPLFVPPLGTKLWNRGLKIDFFFQILTHELIIQPDWDLFGESYKGEWFGSVLRNPAHLSAKVDGNLTDWALRGRLLPDRMGSFTYLPTFGLFITRKVNSGLLARIQQLPLWRFPIHLVLCSTTTHRRQHRLQFAHRWIFRARKMQKETPRGYLTLSRAISIARDN